MKKIQVNSNILCISEAALGGFLYAFAYRFFILPYHLYNGGFTGIAQIIQSILQKFLPFSYQIDVSGIILWVLNIPLFFLVSKIISKNFLAKTIFTVFLQSFFMVIIPSPSVPLMNDCLTTCLIGGGMSGLGTGLALMAGCSGGGSDIVGLYCAIRYPKLSVGKFNFILNTCIYLYCAFEQNFSNAVYSFIFSLIASVIIDHLHHQNIKTNAIIISHCSTIGNDILNSLNRGFTSWIGTAGYSQTSIYIYMTIISKYEKEKLKKIISQKDPHAFVTFTENLEVWGNFEKRFDN